MTFKKNESKTHKKENKKNNRKTLCERYKIVHHIERHVKDKNKKKKQAQNIHKPYTAFYDLNRFKFNLNFKFFHFVC